MRIDLKRKEIVQIFLAQVIASIFTGSVAIGAYHWRLNKRLDKIEYDYAQFEKTQRDYDERLKRAEAAVHQSAVQNAQMTQQMKGLEDKTDLLLRMVENLQRDLTGRVTR